MKPVPRTEHLENNLQRVELNLTFWKKLAKKHPDDAEAKQVIIRLTDTRTHLLNKISTLKNQNP